MILPDRVFGRPGTIWMRSGVAIGPITSRTLVDKGLYVDIEAEVSTIPGLVDAICQWCDGRES